jgi:hypothetical protein
VPEFLKLIVPELLSHAAVKVWAAPAEPVFMSRPAVTAAASFAYVAVARAKVLNMTSELAVACL